MNKSITGAGAGQQGRITITVTCVNNGVITTLQPLFVIPAGATDPGSQTYNDIPGGSVCMVVETEDGNTSTLAVLKPGQRDGGDGPTGRHRHGRPQRHLLDR